MHPDPPLSVCLLYKHIALACFEISFKLHTSDSKHLENFLSMVFADFKFNDDELMSYEIQILNLIGDKIAPNLSPASYYCSFIEVTGPLLSSQTVLQLQRHFNTTMKLCSLGNHLITYLAYLILLYFRFFIPPVLKFLDSTCFDLIHMLID